MSETRKQVAILSPTSSDTVASLEPARSGSWRGGGRFEAI
jgi:hypothetical protein